MSDNKFRWLQFFADGGASGGDGGGDGAGSGVTSADAGQSTGVQAADAGQRLEDLGVPKDKAEKYRQRMAKKGRTVPAKAEPTSEPAPAQAEAPKQDAGNVDVDAIFKIPEVQQRVQAMMAERGRSATEDRNAANELLRKLSPALELLSTRYGKERKDGQYDIDAIIEAVTGDDLFFEDRALETGDSVEKVKADWKKERETAIQQEEERNQQLRNAFFSIRDQAQDIVKEYPDFNLENEMRNPDFVYLASPRHLGGRGWDARRAYRAAHQDEIEQQQAEGIAERVKADAQRVGQSNQARPRENGSAPTSPISTANDYDSRREMYRHMSKEERKRYVMTAYPPR